MPDMILFHSMYIGAFVDNNRLPFHSEFYAEQDLLAVVFRRALDRPVVVSEPYPRDATPES